MQIVYTIIISIFSIAFFMRAKERRDKTGAVRTKESAMFIFSILVALIYWFTV